MSSAHALIQQAGFSAPQLALIRRTVANDCNPDEFNLFIAQAQRAGLDPFKKQIGALVFNKTNKNKRRMVVVTYIDGLRAIAERSGIYSPDDDEPEFTYDDSLKGPDNPLGLLKAVVKVFKNSKAVKGVAYWSEFAPLKEECADGWEMVDTGETYGDSGKPVRKRQPKGPTHYVLDTSGQWGKMGRLMLAKCAEAQALRKAFPEDTGGLYAREELDQAAATDLTASEIVDQAAAEERMLRIGGPGAVLFQFSPDEPLKAVPPGQCADRCFEAIEGFGGSKMLEWFASVNREALNQFWAHHPGDCLKVKKAMEERLAKLRAEEARESEPA